MHSKLDMSISHKALLCSGVCRTWSFMNENKRNSLNSKLLKDSWRNNLRPEIMEKTTFQKILKLQKNEF